MFDEVVADATSGGISTAPLDGLTVHVGDGSLAALATGRWLAALGATVTGVDGDAAPTAVDVVVASAVGEIGAAGPPGPEAALRASITFPPELAHADERALAEGLWARSGLASITRTVGGEWHGGTCLPVTALPQELAAVATALAVAAWAAGPRSPGHDVSVDALEVLTLLPMQPLAAVQLPSDDDGGSGASGGAAGGNVGGIVAARDGAVYLRLVEPVQWSRLLAELPATAHLAAEVLRDPAALDRGAVAIDVALGEWVGARTTAEVLDAARRLQIPVAPFVAASRLCADEHLVARGYADGHRLAVRPPWLVDRRRARPPATQPAVRPAGDRPLHGLRVLDLTWAWAGPFATTLLAELGAEVINIEWRPRPSNLRVQVPIVPGHGVDGAGWWSANQRGKRSVALDLKDPESLAAVLELAGGCDAAIENFSPGVAERLGLGFEALVARNARLVYVSMSAYGATGPRASERGYGPQLYASAGYADVLRGADGGTSQMGIPIGDPISGMVAALALVAHLCGRDAVHIDAAELEAVCAVHGADLSGSPPSNPTIRSIADTLHDPYLVERGAWAPDHAAAMAGLGVRIARAPWTWDGNRPPAATGAPRLGADTRRTLRDDLGWEAPRVDALIGRGVALEPDG